MSDENHSECPLCQLRTQIDKLVSSLDLEKDAEKFFTASREFQAVLADGIHAADQIELEWIRNSFEEEVVFESDLSGLNGCEEPTG